MIDPVTFGDRYDEAIAQAVTFAKRKIKGIPQDRWASAREMHLVADGIAGLLAIIAAQTDLIEALTREDA